MESPFEVLSLDDAADAEEIERAYRRRIKEAHPDRGGSVEEFKAVRTAYETLMNGAVHHEHRPVSHAERDPDEPRQEACRVEYLNYEILDDHGWSLDDENLFEKASERELAHEDYGRFLAQPGESLLEAAENRGFAWPYACRGGACANCAVAVVDGDLDMPVDHILPTEMTERGIQLSCVGSPVTDDMRVVYNIKHLPSLEELRLPPRPFEQATRR